MGISVPQSQHEIGRMVRVRDNKNKMKLLDQFLCDSEGQIKKNKKTKKNTLQTREHFTLFKPLIEIRYNLKRNFYTIQLNIGSYIFPPKKLPYAVSSIP